MSAYLQRIAAPRTWRWIWTLDAMLVAVWAVELIAASIGNHPIRNGWVGAVFIVSVFVVAPICSFFLMRTFARRAALADLQNRP